MHLRRTLVVAVLALGVLTAGRSARAADFNIDPVSLHKGVSF